MNPLGIVWCLASCLVAATMALPNAGQNSKPSQWLSSSELDSIPSIEDINLENLERMPLDKGARMVEAIYHLSQINGDLSPSYVPSPSNIPVTIVKPNGPNVKTNLNSLVSTVQQEPNFGQEEVTVFITGLPKATPTITKAYKKVVEAYQQRYNSHRPHPQDNQNYDYDNNNKAPTSSEENDNDDSQSQNQSRGNLIVIDLGSTLTNFKRYAMLDTEQTGAMLGKVLVEMTNGNVPQEIVKVVAQGIAAHVAGAAGRTYTRLTGHQLRRITALDPSKIFAKKPNTVTGLARGDAEFVDAIHTSTYGMGTPQRVGDADFYPNGPSAGVPGAENVVEATMRATRYYAESVRPGNERNFPAVPANSMKQYESNNGHGKRAYMGIDAEFDLEGDYMLPVNAKSPFGKNTPAQKQNSYHGTHQAQNSPDSQDYQ